MPRQHVRQEDRQRAYQACLACKACKKRCDSQVPCGPCVKRSCASSCKYPGPTNRRRQPSMLPQKMKANREARRSQSRVDTIEADDPLGPGQEGHDVPPEISAPREDALSTTSSTSVAQETSASMLLNSKGERVYIGESASISFLHFLRRSFQQYMGPSLFTQSNRRNVMLEVESTTDDDEDFVMSAEHKRTLVDCYFSATSGLLDLYDRKEVSKLLARKECNSNDNAAVSLIIAIGGQCRGIDSFDRHYASACFATGQKTAFEGMLQDPSLDLVRLFLLMAFYMLGACRRNAAFMYIGVASKAACTLGLHVADQYRIFDQHEQNLRLRTYKSLCNLDVIVTSILGRAGGPSSVNLGDFSRFPATPNEMGDLRQPAMHAVFGTCSVIQNIIQFLYEGKNVDINSAERFLQQLAQWRSTLPSEVCEFTQPTGTPGVVMSSAVQSLAIGNIHVACIYYFAVLLITRPFLIAHVMSRLRNRAGQYPVASAEVIDNNDVFRLSQVCIDSAIYMAQICNDAVESGLLLGNMCIIKAWIFAAGLVLGFSIFAEGELRCDMEQAFTSACSVLSKLARLSPQAEHYLEILTELLDANNKHREKLANDRRRANDQYVSRILTIKSAPLEGSLPEDMPDISVNENENAASEYNTTRGERWFGDVNDGGVGTRDEWDQLDFGLGFYLANWDNVDLQIPVDFTTDGASLEIQTDYV